MKFVSQLKRSEYCGKLSSAHVGQKVVLMGWVDVRRDHGSLVFIDLRDRDAGLIELLIEVLLELFDQFR